MKALLTLILLVSACAHQAGDQQTEHRSLDDGSCQERSSIFVDSLSFTGWLHHEWRSIDCDPRVRARPLSGPYFPLR